MDLDTMFLIYIIYFVYIGEVAPGKANTVR